MYTKMHAFISNSMINSSIIANCGKNDLIIILWKIYEHFCRRTKNGRKQITKESCQAWTWRMNNYFSWLQFRCVRNIVGFTKYIYCAYGSHFVVFCCGLIWTDFTHFLQGYFTGTGAIIGLPQCQWSNPEEYECVDESNEFTSRS